MLEEPGGLPALHRRAVRRGETWTAFAEQADTGHRFGIECTGATEAIALARLSRWLDWQIDHSSALAALQTAERAYHRVIAGNAFGSPLDDPSAADRQRSALMEIDAARARLDVVRNRRPEHTP
jgi:hypothetical protein